MRNLLSSKTILKVASTLAVAFTLSATVEAQRFGGYYYTGQQTLQFSGQNRVCKVYGFDFAKFDRTQSKIVDVKFTQGGVCQTNAGKWNGDCCTVSYTNGQPATTQQAAPNRQVVPTRQVAPTRQRSFAPVRRTN